ncbi:MAG: von Willebrand factor type A domain-containing protein [Planctomycetes bacterium]|nr:von Willebrand factor type A domain-containing protein [Planctomycetota bacterium]
MNCREIEARLADCAVGELPEEWVALVEDHVASCPSCRRALEERREAIGLVAAIGKGSAPRLAPARRAKLLAATRPPAGRHGARLVWLGAIGSAAAAVVVWVALEQYAELNEDREHAAEVLGGTATSENEDEPDASNLALVGKPLTEEEANLIETERAARSTKISNVVKDHRLPRLSPGLPRGTMPRIQAAHVFSDGPDEPGVVTNTEKALAAGVESTEERLEIPSATHFEHAGFNPVQDPKETVLSTFALDVDTGSYTIARSYLQANHLPPPAAVRTEEFLNYFDYGYAGPEEGPFAIHLEGAPSRFGAAGTGSAATWLLAIGIQAKRIAREHRRSAALTFVVDVSGSMAQGNRLGLVKEALALLVDELHGEDRVAIVAYDDEARVVLPPTSLAKRDEIVAAIRSLAAGGSTNAEAGLDLGYRLAIENFAEGFENRVILCSDGVANVGRTGPLGILARVKDCVDDGITLSTVGVGMGNYNDVLLEGLADAGNGNYAYVDRLEEARRVFVENLTGTLQRVAKDAKVQVEFDPAVIASYRLLGYENRRLANEEFRNDRVDAGEIGAGHAATALYEIRFREGGDGTAAVVRLRWQDPDSGKVTEISRRIERDGFHLEFSSASARYRLASCVAAFAEILRGQEGKGPEDLGVVAEVARNVAREFDDAPRVLELAELVARARELRSRER